MTQEKLKRVVTAAAVAGTLVIVCLLAVIVYQIVKIAVLDNRIKNSEEAIAYLTEQKANQEDDLEFYLSDFYLEQEARKNHFINPGDK